MLKADWWTDELNAHSFVFWQKVLDIFGVRQGDNITHGVRNGNLQTLWDSQATEEGYRQKLFIPLFGNVCVNAPFDCSPEYA